MARTKQTARMCSQKPATMKKSRIMKPNRSRSASSSSHSDQEIDVTHQQFSLKFDNQAQCEKNAIKQERVACKNCKAFLNYHSQLENSDLKISSEEKNIQKRPVSRSKRSDAQMQEIKAKGVNLWSCEFCNTRNQLSTDITLPTEQNPCYLLQEQKKIKQERNEQNNGEKMVIYCIDISGSMDTIYQNKSRLDAVKEAIRDQIKRMKFQNEKVKVAVVTFGSSVSIKMKAKDVLVPSERYMNFEQIVDFCKDVKQFALPIQTSHKHFEKMIEDMTTYGSTALGPGLLTAICLGGRQRGSKIVMCTDGEANVGLLGPAFYTKAADYAKDLGVMVSILSIKGDRCNLKELGKLTLSTGGSILKIDPSLLGSQFNKISRDVVIGTDSNLTIIVNHFFEIQNANPLQISDDKTILKQYFGNFTADTELTFNFRVLSNEEALKKGVSMEIIKQKRLPMQIQLSYTGMDGNKYLQIVNDHRQLTLNQKEVYQNTDFSLFSASVLQKTSKLIKESKFAEAQSQIKRFRSLVAEFFSKKQKKEVLEKFNERIDTLDRVLKSKMQKTRGSAVKIGTARKATLKKQIRRIESSSSRGRGRARIEGRSDSSQSIEKQEQNRMESDSEEQVLFKEMRARSRSRSPK